ncbi:MAG: 2-oxo acid dehydrogenase subunit E2 [Clostridia bacterium]|nr:2-oxo acid dehydrogenase subunit E2 [Clostridia bacterium]
MEGRKKRRGDRKDGRLLRTREPMSVVETFILVDRVGATNFIQDKVEISKAEEYIRRKRDEGLSGFGLMHVMVASYVRVVSQMPAVNRFVSGQRVYARDRIEVNIDIKKEMTLEAPNTCVKIILSPEDTAEQVYYKMKEVIDQEKNRGNDSDFDGVAATLAKFPKLFFKFSIWFLKLLDYFGLLPKSLLEVSPFHGSFFITSMGSLRIPPIFHHLYSFGNVPVFCATGPKRTEYEIDRNGEIVKRKYMDYTLSTDERIVDGYYFATAFRKLRQCFSDPDKLDLPPEQIVEDID